jgi:hypothetical protein
MPATSRSIAASALAIAALALTTTPSQIRAQAPAIARTADGKPDLSGIWQAVTSASWDIQDHHAQRGVPAGPSIVDGGEIPYQPWAAAKKRENYEHRATAWFDHAGNFHSDALHIVERYTPDGPDHITYNVTIEDPKVFTRPWTMSLVLYRHKEKNFQLLEYACDAFDVEKYYP